MLGQLHLPDPCLIHLPLFMLIGQLHLPDPCLIHLPLLMLGQLHCALPPLLDAVPGERGGGRSDFILPKTYPVPVLFVSFTYSYRNLLIIVLFNLSYLHVESSDMDYRYVT